MDDISLNDPDLLDSFNIFEESPCINSHQIQELEQENKKQKTEIEALIGSLHRSQKHIFTQDVIIDDLKRKNEAQKRELDIKDRTIKKIERENKTLIDHMIFMESQAVVIQQVTQGAIDARDEKIRNLEKPIIDNHYICYGHIKPK